MLHGDNRPIHQANHLLNNGFNPNLEHGQLRGNTVDNCVWCRDVVQVCLMEHEWIVVQTQEMARVCRLFNTQERVPITSWGWCVGIVPFGNSTVGKLALG